MTRSWAEFLGDREDAPAADEEKRRGWLGRLRESLTSSRQALTRELLFDPGDEESWERIEEALIAADCGVGATVEIVRRLEEREPASRAELLEGLEEVVSELVTVDGQERLALGDPPSVVLVVAEELGPAPRHAERARAGASASSLLETISEIPSAPIVTP